jgi:acetate kinase
MRILCLNVGSSSFKWSMLDMPEERLLVAGEDPLEPGSTAPLDLGSVGRRASAVDVVAHRFVHGGGRFHGPTLISDAVLRSLDATRSLDPTHTPKALAGVAAARAAFPGLPQVACFDTGFHASLPAPAYTYAVPSRWTAEWGLRRYGFHGLSVAYAAHKASELLGESPANLLVCHLGSGSSITAVREGRSVDTTMGFTPLEGLPMATRSGSIDPGLLLYLMREKGMSAAEVESALEQESGLRGLAGTSDLRVVLRRSADGNASAQLAYAAWMTGVRRGFGAMLSSLEGLDAVVFTGGIGEHQPGVRRDVLAPFAWCGIALDVARNLERDGDARVSPNDSSIPVLRIQAREDVTMAREAVELLS